MAAVLIYFRDDLWRIVRTWAASLRRPELRSELDARMGWYIGLGTIPIAIFGFLFRDQIESGGRNLYLIGSAPIVLGLVLLYAHPTTTRNPDPTSFSSPDPPVPPPPQAGAPVPRARRPRAAPPPRPFL